MSSTRKISVSLPASLVADLDQVAFRCFVSRSSVISGLLSELLPLMSAALAETPGTDSPQDAVRYRGRSVALVRERLEELQRLVDAFDPQGVA